MVEFAPKLAPRRTLPVVDFMELPTIALTANY